MRWSSLLIWLWLAFPLWAAETSLLVYPESITLDGVRSSQRVIVLHRDATGLLTDVTLEAKFNPSEPKVTVTGFTLTPLQDGEFQLQIQAKGLSRSVPVLVKNTNKEEAPDFIKEVQPILTRLSCNSGGCHGAQHGRGGFRLSLFGFDSKFDHSQIVDSAEGRRVVLSDPERSILLQKPAGIMEHGGGERLKLKSREYWILQQWLAEGAPPPAAKKVSVRSLTIYPSARVMKPGEKQAIVVMAEWSDGQRQDVTGNAMLNSLNESIAQISPDGIMECKGAGETHIMVRFAGQANVVRVTSPFAPSKNFTWDSSHFIDEKLASRWRELGLAPSPVCSDEEFLRRVYLDTIGTLPTPEEVRKFLADPNKEKRAKLIDALLERNEFIDFWSLKWGDLLRINRDALTEKGMWSFHNWVRASIRDRKGIDQFAREILTAEGSTFTDGPANFFRLGRTPEDWAESATQVFLGVRIQCAKCHHHPFEKWSQDDYYAMTAFFARMASKGSQEFGLFGQETVIFVKNTGETTHPRTRQVMKPRPPEGPPMDDEWDRRVKLAEWLTAKDNPFFAKNITNRVWGYFMGRGLVEPLDDIRQTNPASHPELLEALAKDFVEKKFDFRALIRTICNSRAYQLSSLKTVDNQIDAQNIYYTRYTTKRLTAEQLADAIDQVTGSPQKYTGLPAGTRAIQLPDPRVASYLMDTFGRPSRSIVCECERSTSPTIAQALHLLNGDLVNKKITDPKGVIATKLAAKTQTDTLIEEFYLSTLSRKPRPEELAKAREFVANAKSLKEGLEDLLWTLINSREFLFNH